MNHECPHCYVNLKTHGLRTRLVKVNGHTGLYPCCPYCRTVLDLNLPPTVQTISMASIIATSLLLSQTVQWFQSLGYMRQDAYLLGFLLLIVMVVLTAKLLLRLLPDDFSIWRMVGRPAYISRFSLSQDPQ